MISPRLAKVFRTRTGNKFFGLLSDPEDRFEGDRVQARRILRVNPGVDLPNGTVATSAGISYLLIHHSTDRYLAFLVNATLEWKRRTVTIDPVTRMETDGGFTSLDAALPVVLENNMVIEEKGLERVRYRLRAGGNFEVGDQIGPYTVHSVQNVAGACIMEAF